MSGCRHFRPKNSQTMTWHAQELHVLHVRGCSFGTALSSLAMSWPQGRVNGKASSAASYIAHEATAGCLSDKCLSRSSGWGMWMPSS